jgi:hypothetical protein
MRNTVVSVTVMHWCSFGGSGLKSLLKITGKTREEAIKRWNTRTDPGPAGELVERLRKHLGTKSHEISDSEYHADSASLLEECLQALQGVRISRECLEELVEAAESTAEEFSDDLLKEDSFIGRAVFGLKKRIAEAKKALEQSNGR